jgi:predicted CXXCH cytochrome family protein
MKRNRRLLALLPALLLVVAAFGGCTDETIIYRDFPLYEEPLEAAGGFVGYSSTDSKLVVCGNCHVSAQAQWDSTAHAGAWEGLQASGGAQTFCEGCHTVSELGNAATNPAGHTATGEERYYDVQCESCHGSGLAHVEDPNKQTVPLAMMDVGDITPAGRDGCENCHTGEGALDMFGVQTNYTEKADLGEDGQHMAITCAVCHDPHGSENSAQLRFPIDVPSEEVNLCIQCHQKRGRPDPGTFRGPHSPEGPTLLGTAGWWPPDFQGPIISTHGSAVENPRLCAGCHVQAFEVTDEVTGDFLFNATGHRFEATPCVDAQGLPTDGPCDDDDKTYVSCTECHSEAVARQLVSQAELSVAPLIAELDSLLQLVDPAQFNDDDDLYTVAEGSRFNLELAETTGSVVHNPFLIRALLNASIAEMKDRYGL